QAHPNGLQPPIVWAPGRTAGPTRGRGGAMTVRDIDRVRRRQRWRARSDRAITVMVVSLAVIAGITLLPQAWQQTVISGGCRALSLGVTDCVARLYEPPAPDLRAVPLCEVDQVTERMVPTVERQRIRFSSGGE